LARITSILHEDQYAFMNITRSVLLRSRNVSDKSCRENQNTHFVFNNLFRKSCRLWERVEKYFGVGRSTYGNTAHEHYML